MGTCSSNVTQTEVIHITTKKKKIGLPQKHIFKQIKQYQNPHSLTSNGKITDLITKTNKINYRQYQQKYESLIKQKKDLYYDPDFPAFLNSIGKNKKYNQPIQWYRPSHLIQKQLKIFSGQIHPYKIQQGKINNNYFICALVFIKQRSYIIQRLLYTLDINKYGMYGIWLCIDGNWTLYVIDDQFPTILQKPLFSITNNDQLWISLLQKAFSRAYGSYQNVQNFSTGIFLSCLTGAPYEYFVKDKKSKTDPNQLWDFIKKYENEKSFMLIASKRSQGLFCQQSYSYLILEAKPVIVKTKKQQKNQRLIKLSNIYAKFEWTGKWSSTSKKWTKEIKQQLNYNDKQEGVFWMNIDNFCQMFGQVCVVKYYPKYKYTSLLLKFKQQQHIAFKGIFLKTVVKTKGFLTVVQKDRCQFPEKDYKYSLLRIIVTQINLMTRTIYRYLNDLLDCNRDSTIQLDLQIGTYYIALEIQWNTNITRQLILNFYGQEGVILIEDQDLPVSMDSLLNEMIIVHEITTPKERIHQYALDPKIKKITGNIAGYVYYHYKNESQSHKYLKQKVILKERNHISTYNCEKNDEFEVTIYPGQQKIFKLRVDNQGNGYYSYATKIQFYIIQYFEPEVLKKLCDKNPTKVKKRQIMGKPIQMIVKTYNYSGGVAMLYQNKLERYSFVQQLILELQNLQLQDYEYIDKNKIEIVVEPNQQKLLSFIVKQPGKPITFKTNMYFYLNSPEFKF